MLTNSSCVYPERTLSAKDLYCLMYIKTLILPSIITYYKTGENYARQL